ncbi:TPA: maltose acetyltransferase domain-containing protein, partial [Streptococcus agalactiae]
MTEKEKMLAGQYYRPSAPELRKDREVALKNMQAFNNEDNSSKRNVILQKWFGATGKSIHMEQRFVCDYGCNIYVGENFYA